MLRLSFKNLHEEHWLRRRTLGSGLCGSPEEVVACQCWEERASTWSGCRTHREAKANHSVGVVRHVAAHDLSLSCRRVRLMMFSAIDALLTFAQASESLPYKTARFRDMLFFYYPILFQYLNVYFYWYNLLKALFSWAAFHARKKIIVLSLCTNFFNVCFRACLY